MIIAATSLSVALWERYGLIDAASSKLQEGCVTNVCLDVKESYTQTHTRPYIYNVCVALGMCDFFFQTKDTCMCTSS